MISDDDGVDASPLLQSSERSVETPSFEQDATASTVTLTDFRLASVGGDAPAWRHPVRSAGAYLSRLSSAFSWKFLSWLAIENFALAGGVGTMLWSVGLPLFKELGVDASRQQMYTTMIISPFALKPFIGLVSDLFPIGGYNKRYLAMLSIALGLLGCSALLVLYRPNAASEAVSGGPASARRLADLVVACFFAMTLEGATLDTLGEGKYSELMRLRPESGSSLITFKFVCSLAGSVVTQAYVGPLSDAGRFRLLFWIALALLLTPLYPTLRGWIPEKRRTAGATGLCLRCTFDGDAFRKKRALFITIALSGLAAPVMSAVSVYSDLRIGLLCSGFLIVALVGATYAVFPRKFFRITLGMIVMILSRIKMSSGLSYFYTANKECLPNGPNFSYTFYVTLMGVVGSVIHLLAVMLYQIFMSSWKYRPALIFTLVVGSLATFIDLIIVMRWNIAIGISDKIFFLLGNATFESLTNILHAIPMSTIYAKISPPGVESSVFAYSVGIGTFCFMVANLLGSGIIRWSGMKTVGEDCNFDSLPRLMVVFQVLVPLLVGIPATLFIPNVAQTEQLIDWEEERWYEDEAKGQNETFDTEEEVLDSHSSDLRVEAPGG